MATCANCGEHLASDWKYCIHCGQRIGGDAVPAAIRPEAGAVPTRKPVNWFAIAGIGALILGIGLIAISVTYLVGALR